MSKVHEKRVFAADELQALSMHSIVQGLENGKSLLLSLGATKMYQDGNLLRRLCRLVIFWAFQDSRSRDYRAINRYEAEAARKRLLRLLKLIAPVKVVNQAPHPPSAVVIGFNHPSLGEILRFLRMMLDDYYGRQCYFPVTIKFYEVLAPIAVPLRAVGIHLYPIITPAAQAEISAELTDLEGQKQLHRLMEKLNTGYIKFCKTCMDQCGVLMIAPTATRCPTVFHSYAESIGLEKVRPGTLTILAVKLGAKEPILYQPVAVLPPNDQRGLNLFQSYQLTFLEQTWAAKNAYDQSKRGTEFERFFLTEIARALPKSMHYPNSALEPPV